MANMRDKAGDVPTKGGKARNPNQRSIASAVREFCFDLADIQAVNVQVVMKGVEVKPPRPNQVIRKGVEVKPPRPNPPIRITFLYGDPEES